MSAPLPSAILDRLASTDRPDWRHLALCAQIDMDLWFPEKGGTTKHAKAICARCDVRTECLTLALDNEERFGIWGGFSERERRRLLRAGVA